MIVHWFKRKSSSGIGTLCLVVFIAACGNQDDGVGTEEATASSETSGSEALRSVMEVDLCAAIPLETVAKILGSTTERISGETTQGTYATDCTYTVDRGQGMHDYAIIFAYPPELWSGEVGDDSEPVEGLGDKAYLGKTASFSQLRVLAGGLFLDVRADSPEQARALAELAIERLAAR